MILALQMLLCTIAAIVAYGLYKKQNMWVWIIAYWLVLTIKNFLEILGV